MEILRVASLGLLQVVLLSGSIVADDDVVPGTATAVKFDFAQWCKVGDHTFILEKTTLADVIQAIGRGVIHFNGGDASKGEFFVDYTENGRLIRFSSNAEMGGDTHDLEEIDIMPLTADKKAAGLPPLHLPVTFQFGSEGMLFSDLVTVLGPSVRTRGVAWYEYNGKRPIKNSSGKVLDYDVLATLRVNVVAGKVAAMQLTHVSSF